MKNFLCFAVLLSLLCCKISFTNAQVIDSVLRIYGSNYEQEKMHIHFDKNGYNKGETVWYKAYVMTGSDLSDYSKNVYFDWYDDNGKLLKHCVSPMFESSAKGQFAIPENYQGSYIHLKAYTQWMLNFDSAFFFTKNIRINQVNPKKLLSIKPVVDLKFFPEGGDIVNGLPSKIAFKATDQFGKPIKVTGVVKNNKDEIVDSLITQHDGMGFISILQPDTREKYTVYWTDEYTASHKSNFPVVKKSGVSMQVATINNKAVVELHRTDDVDDGAKILNMVATINQQLIYRSRINLKTNTSGVASVNLTDLPTGVLLLTVFNSNWLPLAERVVFVNNHNYLFNPSVNVIEKGLNKRSKNVIEVNIPDTIISNLSLAITDGDLTTDTANNIISQFLSCGELKGYIQNPAYYFSNNSDSVAANLDLVMLTHGWRRYKWDEIVQAKTPVLKYPKETSFLSINGKIFTSTKSSILPGEQVIAFLQSKNNTKQMMMFPVNKDGSFSKDGLIFFDTLKIYYQFVKDKRLENHSEITFQNGLLAEPKNLFKGSLPPFQWSTDTSEIALNRYFAQQKVKVDFLRKTTTLKEVVVTTRAKSPVDILDEKYTTGMFSGPDAGYQFDVMNDTRAQSSYNVFQYLQGTVPGLQIYMDPSTGSNELKWRGNVTDIFLDEMKIDPELLTAYSMNDIAYIKVYRPPFYGSSGGGAGGAVAIYTRQGTDVQSKKSDIGGLSFKYLSGYSSYKEFYSPDYAKDTLNFNVDVRTTLYWNPFMLTDQYSHKVKIEFYNNDVTKKFRIILEGVNANGKLARVEKEIQ